MAASTVHSSPDAPNWAVRDMSPSLPTIIEPTEMKPTATMSARTPYLAQPMSMSVVATGIAADGSREILGLDVGNSEDEVFWRGFLTSLKQRGLGGVRLVISDQHTGLVKALKRSFQGTGHQRCRVHFARNLLAHVPKGHQNMLAAVFRTIFAQPDPATVEATWDSVRDPPAGRFPKSVR